MELGRIKTFLSERVHMAFVVGSIVFIAMTALAAWYVENTLMQAINSWLIYAIASFTLIPLSILFVSMLLSRSDKKEIMQGFAGINGKLDKLDKLDDIKFILQGMKWHMAYRNDLVGILPRGYSETGNPPDPGSPGGGSSKDGKHSGNSRAPVHHRD